MFFFGNRKKKEKVRAEEVLLQQLSADTYNQEQVSKLYIQAVRDIVAVNNDYDIVEDQKDELYKKIYASRHGLSWFSQACVNYVESVKNVTEVANIAEELDRYLSFYWYLCEKDPQGVVGLSSKLEEVISPSIRRFYEKSLNVDVYTGSVFDEELEEDNTYKKHFYKASFAYNQGKGDLELSIREWRTFLNELYFAIGTRPRIVYDFAREVVAHQRMFMFLAYAMRVEKMDRARNASSHAEGTPLQVVLSKVINAVYAIDEEYGMLLKQYYV